MNWTPPERPAWVAAINRGEILPITEEAALPLSRDGLLGEACARQGLSARSAAAIDRAIGARDFPAEPWIANLDLLTEALEREASLTIIGRSLTRRFLMRILAGRLQLMAYLESDPGVREERVRAPLVVAGAPRTGTTILHTLLAADPRHRVPLGWELLHPVPPPEVGASETDPRVTLADRELIRPQTVVSGLQSIHVYGGRKPKECLSAMSFALQSEEFTARYHVPSYANWLESSDMKPAYQMHRLVLQVLQRRQPGTAWVLKSPVHLHSLPTLFETYPDARVAITHRDPLTLLGSLTSLIANLRFAHSDAIDIDAIAHAHHERYRRSFDALVDWMDDERLPASQLHQSLFEDFLTHPLAVVEALYARFGIALGSAEKDAMEAALARHPRDEKGPHVYARTGHPNEDANPFARYQRHFGIPPGHA